MPLDSISDLIARANSAESLRDANASYEVYALSHDLADNLKVDIGRTRALTKLLHTACDTSELFPLWLHRRDARSTLEFLQAAAHVARGQDKRILYALASMARSAPDGVFWVRRRC